MGKRKYVPGCVDLRCSKDGLYLATLAEGNRATLNHTETFSSRQRAIGNIISTCKVYNSPGVLVRDCTGEEERYFIVDMTESEPRIIDEDSENGAFHAAAIRVMKGLFKP